MTNLAQANPERISDGIAAIFEPALTRPELQPIADTDSTMQSRVRQLVADAAAGQLSPAEFAYVRAGFFPATAQSYVETLRDAGPVTKLALLEKRKLGDDESYTYDVTFAQKTLRLTMAVAPDGKIASFSLRPTGKT